MTAAKIRQQLFEYIRFADEKKVKAIYTIVEEEINEKHDIWTEAFAKEMDKRASDVETGKIRGLAWEEVKSSARARARKKR